MARNKEPREFSPMWTVCPAVKQTEAEMKILALPLWCIGTPRQFMPYTGGFHSVLCDLREAFQHVREGYVR